MLYDYYDRDPTVCLFFSEKGADRAGETVKNEFPHVEDTVPEMTFSDEGEILGYRLVVIFKGGVSGVLTNGDFERLLR